MLKIAGHIINSCQQQKSINKIQQKIQMSRQTKYNQNPQISGSVDIAGYLRSIKLYKKDNQKSTPPKRINNYEQIMSSPKNHNFIRQQKRQNSPMSGRHTILSQNYKNNESPNSQGYYTSRNYEKQADKRVSFQLEDREQSANINTGYQNPMNVATKNRFYYKDEYGIPLQVQSKNRNDQTQNSYQHRILPGYFNKLNSQLKNNRQLRHNMQSNVRTKTTRSKSPLEQSHRRLFSKCYKQTYQYLYLMLNEINSSEQKIVLTKTRINQNICYSIEQRAITLREQLIDLIEEIVAEWERKQLNFVKLNQMQYMGDLIQIQQLIKHRQSKINMLIQQLNQQRKRDYFNMQGFSIQSCLDIGRQDAGTLRNVTADLLISNYRDSILQIEQIAERMSLTVKQRSNKAISLLPPTLAFQKPPHYQILSSQRRRQLKQQITAFLNHPDIQHRVNLSHHKQKSQQKKPYADKLKDSLFTLSQYKFNHSY